MQSAGIVEAQPIDDFIHRSTPRREVPTVQSCDLQRTPQAFGWRIISTIATPAHRRTHAVRLERVLEESTAILAATVAMHNHASFRAAPEPCHAQGVRDHFGFHVRLHRPAHHPPAEQVDYDSQIQPTFGRRQWSKRQGVVELSPGLSSPNRTWTSQRIRLSVQALLIAKATSG